VLNKTFSVR